uniref:Uncharacterized protein n=1 Tax=Saccharopolyspora endophytica TaxID=543886 RepID=A0A0C5BVT4_9PSEU|nr:hypothetical protein pCM32.10c [Saccharopolyspora endophytica]
MTAGPGRNYFPVFSASQVGQSGPVRGRYQKSDSPLPLGIFWPHRVIIEPSHQDFLTIVCQGLLLPISGVLPVRGW